MRSVSVRIRGGLRAYFLYQNGHNLIMYEFDFSYIIGGGLSGYITKIHFR